MGAGSALAQTGAAKPAATPAAQRSVGQVRSQGRSARGHRQENRRHQTRRRAHDARQRRVRSHARRGYQLPLERWPLRHSRRHDRPRCRRQPFREPAPRHSRAHDRNRSGKRDAGVLAQGSEVHHHGVHGHRLRLLPPSAFADRRIQQARHSRALHVLPALGPRHRVVAQGRSSVVRVESQRCAHARQEWRERQIAEVSHRDRQARLRTRDTSSP